MKRNPAQLAQAQVDAALLHVQAMPQAQAGLSITAHTVVIGNHVHVGTIAEAETISEAQSRLLKSLVYRIGQAERLKHAAYCDARTWTKANGLVGADHHRDIAKRDFDRVKAYLEGWLRRLDGA